MNETDLHSFSSDRPIKNIEDDLLDRSIFSKSLANAIASWHGLDSLVVAIHGDWGSGKSSIKNMAVAELENLTEKKPTIIEFSPWEWAAQEKITTSFFNEISEAIGRKDKSKEGKELASILKRYGRFLNAGGIITDGLSQALPTIIILMTFTGINGLFSTNDWTKYISPSLLLVLAGFGAFFKWGKKLLTALSDNTDSPIKSKNTLTDIRDELTKSLSARNTSVIIVLDDLDRLTSKQLRMVFQLIKANTEFPNVVFLLLFQRNIVEEKLDDGNQTGRDYLEKIIQVPFDIPKIDTPKLHNILFTRIDKIISQDPLMEETFDKMYWGNIFYGSLHTYFITLRNIYRFSSTLSFHFELLRGRKTFEANPIDLIAIECLRIFEPNIYKEIAKSKHILCNHDTGAHNDRNNPIQGAVEKILALANPGKSEIIKNLIRNLFPNIEWVFGGAHYASGFSDQWLKKLRICHQSNFDKYFQFSIPSGELSNSDLLEMLSLTSNADSFYNFIYSLNERGIVKNALAQFESFIDDVPIADGFSFVKALLNIGDQVDNESIGLAMFSSNVHAIRLVTLFLRRIESLEDRSQLLKSCFEVSRGVSIVERILLHDEQRRQENEGNYLLADNIFEELKGEFVKKISTMADNSPNVLLNSQHLVSFLYRWKKWGDADAVSSWLKKTCQSQDASIALLRAFVSKRSSHGLNDHVAKITNHIKLESIENFISINEIENQIANIDPAILDNQSREALDAFREALDLRSKGINNDW